MTLTIPELSLVLLVGPSYVGAVIAAAATDNPQVKALIYIAAIVPDEGEAVGTLFQRAEPNPSVRPHPAPDAESTRLIGRGEHDAASDRNR